MVQVDIPGAFTVGQVFAWLSRKYLKKTPDKFTHQLLGPFNFYLACGFIPSGLFLFIGWPSWELMYTTAWAENPFNRPLVTGFYVLFVIVLMIMANLGYILGHQWYLKGKDKLLKFGIAGGAFLTLLPFICRWGVWWQIGDYKQIAEGTGYSFWSPPFFYGWLFAMSYMIIVTIVTGIWFRKKAETL